MLYDENIRQVETDNLNSLNLKNINNLNEYRVLIVGIEDAYILFKDLRSMVKENDVKLCEDIEESLNLIESWRNMNIFVIISGKLGKDHAHKLADQQEIVGIYVYCMNVNEHRKWTDKIKKIHCTVSNATDLLKQLNSDIRYFSGRWSFDERTYQKTTTSVSYWYDLFLFVICNRSERIQESYAEMFDECRKYYENSPNVSRTTIDRVQEEYKPEKAIQEYTKNGFIYRIVNHALRTKDIAIIRKFSPYIRDLHVQINRLQKKQYQSKKNYIRSVYRGQCLTAEELNYLRTILKSNNPVLTLTTFSSTSLDTDVALRFISSGNMGIPCLFEMIIPDLYNAADEVDQFNLDFANISSESANKSEKEVLFSLKTYFHIKHIGNEIHQKDLSWIPIQLELIHRKEAGIIYQAALLEGLISKEHNQQVYNDVLNMIEENSANELKFQSTNWQNWWNKFNRQQGKGLGEEQSLDLVFYDCFSNDLKWSRKAIELQKINLLSHPGIQSNINSFEYVYRQFINWCQRPTIQIAIYEKYLEQLCTENTHKVEQCFCLAGQSYKDISEYDNALKCYEKALKIENECKQAKRTDIEKKINEIKKLQQKESENISKPTNDNKKKLAALDENDKNPGIIAQIINNERLSELVAGKHFGLISNHINNRERWYDTAEAKIILRMPYEDADDLSVNDYRLHCLLAVNEHQMRMFCSRTDAADNLKLSRWRYERYLTDWVYFRKLERYLRSNKNIPSNFSLHVLRKLERLIKKLSVLVVTTMIYISSEGKQCQVNVKKIRQINKTNPLVKQLFDINLKDHQTEDSVTIISIPDHKRLITNRDTIADFISDINQ